ncbi:hypothetical protein H9P43_002046 [Blastocladiella emersonii ATCC 22665]|nr:hypothetical protein H9P43_002046 [Blastocladiella emersonii ATCC 22665]
MSRRVARPSPALALAATFGLLTLVPTAMADGIHTESAGVLLAQDAPGFKYFSRPVILTHGVLMLALFGFVLPAAAFFARYYRTNSRWMPIHAGVQMLGGLLVLLSAVLVLTNDIHCKKYHRYFGYVIMGLTGVQLLGGLAHFRTMTLGAARTPQKTIRRNGRLHAACGVTLLLLGFVNMPQGIHHDFSFDTQPWAPMYLYYYAVLLFWATLFTVKEVSRWRAEAAHGDYDLTGLNAPILPNAGSNGSGETAVDPHANTALRGGTGFEFNSKTLANSSAASLLLGAPAPIGSAMARRLAAEVLANPSTANLPTLTWEAFNRKIADENRQLVVGVGGLVLDVSQWITAHPGGQQVLLDAIGTSIVIDMFIEEEYDKSLFKAFAGCPTSKSVPPTDLTFPPATPTSFATNPNSRTTMSVPPSVHTHQSASFAASGEPSVNAAIAERRITQAEWVHVLASRRTNIHSRTAIAKLMTMAVARVPEAGHAFSKFEFRRYALSQKTLVSPPGVSGTAAVYHLTFCLLYPHEAYPEEPSFFLPGHVVEIRMRLPRAMARRNTSGSPYVTRYYTPISGNATHFTIAIKMRPGGLMSDLLTDLWVEHHRQFQIRGPFGSPLLNPARALPLGNGSFDHVVFIGVGSGTTPGLQSAAFQFAQTYFPQVAAAAHAGSSANELRVSPRDRVLIKYPMHSGWVWATNTTTHCDGYLPLRTLVPWVGRATRFTMVAADATLDHVVGRATFDLLRDAYPSQVQVFYRAKSLGPAAAATQYTTQGRVDREYVLGVLQQSGYLAQLQQQQAGQQGLALRVVLCGPQRFLDECYDWLADAIPEDQLWVLPTGSYLTLHEHNTLISGDAMHHQRAKLRESRPRVPAPGAATLGVPTTGSRPTSYGGSTAVACTDDEEEELFLPGLPVHNDANGQGEWFVLPAETTGRPATGTIVAAPRH